MPYYVRSVDNQGTLRVRNIFEKKDLNVHVQDVRLIERSGVNVFELDKEPALVKNAEYDWIQTISTKDKRQLNQILSKIQIRQTNLQFEQEDTFTMDDLSTIQGDIKLSILEVKGLIMPEEKNRKNFKEHLKINPIVEVYIQSQFDEKKVTSSQQYGSSDKRALIFSNHQNKDVADKKGDFEIPLGLVSHSGKNNTNGMDNYASQTSNNQYKPESEKYIHIKVKHWKNDNEQIELGSTSISMDELIDTNLNDLAKEFNANLNRVEILK